MNEVLLYIGSGLLTLLGIIHFASTKPALTDFDRLSKDDFRIALMQWLGTGVALVYVGVVTILVVTYGDPAGTSTRIALVSGVAFAFTFSVLSLLIYSKPKTMPAPVIPFVFILIGVCLLLGVVD